MAGEGWMMEEYINRKMGNMMNRRRDEYEEKLSRSSLLVAYIFIRPFPMVSQFVVQYSVVHCVLWSISVPCGNPNGVEERRCKLTLAALDHV